MKKATKLVYGSLWRVKYDVETGELAKARATLLEKMNDGSIDRDWGLGAMAEILRVELMSDKDKFAPDLELVGGPVGNGWEDLDPVVWKQDQTKSNLGRFFSRMTNSAARLMPKYVEGFMGVGGPGNKTRTAYRVLQKGNLTIQVEEADFPVELVQRAAQSLEDIYTRDPIAGPVVLRLVDYGRIPDGSETVSRAGPHRRKRHADRPHARLPTIGRSLTLLSTLACRRHDKPWAYHDDMDPIAKTLVHEYGHMRGPAFSDPAMKYIQEMVLAARPGAPRAGYEQKDAFEFYAENYFEWMASKGQTTDELARYFAEFVGLPGTDNYQPSNRQYSGFVDEGVMSESDRALADALVGQYRFRRRHQVF